MECWGKAQGGSPAQYWPLGWGSYLPQGQGWHKRKVAWSLQLAATLEEESEPVT